MTLRDDLNHEKLMHQVFEQNANEYLLRAEAAEARAATAEKSFSDTLIDLKAMMQERDEARRQLTEAQRAIDVLSNTVVAQNNEIKRLRQQREDVAECRIRVNELLEACKAARDWFARNTKQGHTPGPVEKMLIDAIQVEVTA